MRILHLQVSEPVPGQVLPQMAEALGPTEAARRYRALVVTTLRQLQGLKSTRLQLQCTPEDAGEAIRFWLLPLLAKQWHARDTVYHAAGWEIAFGPDSAAYEVVAHGEILCPWLCARWVHTAMLGLEREGHRAIGLSPCGLTYFEARSTAPGHPTMDRMLPPLPVIQTDADWQEAMESAIGASLRKSWEEDKG